MSHTQLHQSWSKLIELLHNPIPMRPGSISQQRPSVRREDGSIHYKGPYPLYTFKKEGKTVSRILDEREVPLYRQAVENFHAFLALVEQIKAVGLALAEGEKPELKKTSRSGGRRKRVGGRTSSGASGR